MKIMSGYMMKKMSNEQIAAKIYHALYPQNNYYRTISPDCYKRSQWELMVKELKEQGIING